MIPFMNSQLVSRMSRAFAFLLLIATAFTTARAEKVSLVAGGASNGDGKTAIGAKLDRPFAVAFDKAGNMYIGEYQGQHVKKLDPAGVLTTIAGTGEKGFAGNGGPATACKFNCIHDLVLGPDGDLYIADSFNQRVRKLDLKTGIITTFAGTGVAKTATGDGGPADKAALDGVASLWFDASGKTLYIAGFSKIIRTIDMKTRVINTLADVPGGRSIALDSKDNLYIASGQTLRVRSPDGKVRVLLDKTHTGGAALPLGADAKHLGIDANDNVWICDEQHCLIREYLPSTGKLVTIAGNGKPGTAGIGGPPAALQVNRPHGIYFQPSTGLIFIADSMNDRVLKIEP